MTTFLAFALLFLSLPTGATESDPVVLAIHGGLPDTRAELSAEDEKKIRQVLQQALLIGFTPLRKNGSSLDAVTAAIRVLEDSPLFNAGKGAVFTRDGRNELDAAIMEGKEKRAGAVAGLTIVKNPILAALAVMEKSPHVFLVGPGADAFAQEKRLALVPPEYFKTDRQWERLQQWKRANEKSAAHSPRPADHWGTVGAVALDSHGNLAAGTSTGGMTGKRGGRVGDTPVIGAGTYADNAGAAVSATGHGEYFIRYGVAHEINALTKYQKLPLAEAADTVIQKQLKAAGGEGGVIALNAKGEMAMSFNSEGMFRGYITRSGQTTVKVYQQ